MDNKRRVSREEIRAVYRAGEESVVGLVEGLLDSIERLEERVAGLEAQNGKNSGNSSRPPSSDGLKRGKKRSLRGESGKASGGQEGHEGRTLKAVAEPDEEQIHGVGWCERCAADLSGVAVNGVVRRQVFDLPEVRLLVTEHVAEHKVCPACGTVNRAAFPAGVEQPVQYGPRVRAQLVYFHSAQFISLARTAEMVAGLYGQAVSQATIVAAVAEAAERVGPVCEAVRAHLVETNEVVHCDETGMRVEGKLHWLHSAGSKQATVYTIHPKRGQSGIDALGVLPERQGWVVHDGWKPYSRYSSARHALCNAHHLRELTALVEQQGHVWAAHLRHWLVHAKHLVERACAEGQPALHPEQYFFLTHSFERLLDQAADEIALSPPPKTTPPRRGRPKASPAANLLRRLRDAQPAVLAFLHDFSVPFDNNLAERDVRMVKVQQKISGTFRSAHGARAFCAIRGYLSTARKNGLTPLRALESAFAGHPFYPPCLSPA